MPNKRQSRKVYGTKTHYWNNEIKLLLIAALCVYRALEFSTKAKEVYKSILEAWGRPGCLALIKGNIYLPTSEFIQWEKAVTNKEEYVPKDITFKEAHDAQVNNDDYIQLVKLIAEFIRVGFNHKKGLNRFVDKVSIENTSYLPLAVQIISAGEYVERRPNLDVERELKLGDKVLDANPIIDGVSSERTHRLHTKTFKRYGYNLSHDEKLNRISFYWYQSRVVCSGIEDFCNRHFKRTGVDLDPANINKEILIADKATGYPRKNLDGSIE
jgi:hypothetical protein